jgi:hypothetical protein
MRKHMVGAMTFSLSTAIAVLMLVVGSSAAVADSGRGQGGRGYISGGRHVGQSTNRMGRRAVRGGRYTVGRDRGGRRYGWFNRDRRNYERSFIGFNVGSRRGYRSSGFFFGYSFSWSESRRGSGLRYRRDYRGDYRSDYRSDVPRQNKSSARRAAIEHPTNQPGPIYVPLVASPSAPEILPLKD